METTNTTHREAVSTLDLRAGDIVWNAGMRILLGERNEAPSGMPGLSVPVIVWFHGTVLNAAELDAASYDITRGLRTDTRCTEHGRGEHWQVQGNERATWTREVA